MTTRIPFTHFDRLIILELWQCRCAYCHTPLSQGDDDCDHIDPWSLGGAHALINVASACARCNRAKGAQNAIEFGHPGVYIEASGLANELALVLAGNVETPWLRSRGLWLGALRESRMVKAGWILSGPTKDDADG